MKNLLSIVDSLFPWLLILSTAAFCILTREKIFISSIMMSGVLCVLLAARGNIWTYIVSLYVTLAYAHVSYVNHLYGEMGLNLFFYLPTTIIGFFLWKKHMKNNIVIMRKMTTIYRIILFINCLCLAWLAGYLLSLIPTQSTPHINGLTNILAIAATLLMIYRFQEQWFLHIATISVTIFMWFLRSSAGSTEGNAMIFMWFLYLLNSFYGAIKWRCGAGLTH